MTPTFNAVPAFCAGTTAPVLPTTSTNSITGTWNPSTVSNTASGSYTFTPTAGQCANTASLSVTVNQPVTPTFNAVPAFCAGTTAPVLPTTSTNSITGTWNPSTVSNTASGSYTFTPTAGQCANTASLSVTVNPLITPVFNAEPPVCSGSPAPLLPTTSLNTITGTWSPDPVSNTISGTYTFTPTAGQCATTTTLNITVDPTFSTVVDDTICQGESYLLPDGLTVFNEGTYVSYLQAANLCDSIVTVNLTVNPIYQLSRTATICQGQAYILPNGQPVTAPGTYPISLTTTEGCDSSIVTTLFVRPNYNISRTVFICPGDTLALPNGQLVDTAGVFTILLFTQFGCDSIIRTTVLLWPEYEYTIQPAICEGQTYQLPNGQVVSTSGNYLYSGFTRNGCDSIIHIDLTVHPLDSVYLNVSICQGSFYRLPSGTLVGQSGVYPSTIPSSFGCDSLITVTLTVSQVITNILNPSICQGESYVLPGGATVTNSLVDTFRTQTPSGCDSTVITRLTVNEVFSTTQTRRICQGDPFNLPGGDPANVSGTYVDTLTTVYGCDSIITTFLTVDPVYTTYINETICTGTYATLVNGDTTSRPGTHVVVLPTVNGCDSNFVYSIAVTPPPTFSESVDLCLGETFVTPGGTIIGTAGLFCDTLSNNGCDSLIFYFVTQVGFPENQISGPVIAFDYTSGTYSVPYTPGHFYSWTVIGGTTPPGQDTSSITVLWNQPGVGQVILVESNTQCTYSDTLDVSINSNAVVSLTGDPVVRIFPNPFHDRLHVEWEADAGVDRILLMDLTGRVVSETPVKAVKELDLELSSVAPGVYLIAVLGEKSFMARVVHE